MRHSRTLLLILLILGLAATAGGCKKKQPEQVPPVTTEPAKPPTPPPAPPVTTEPEQPPFEEAPLTRSELIDSLNREGRLKTVYFSLDSSELGEATRRTLQQNADLLKGEAAQVNVVIEGHCDERGSIEYNLALGDRRAAAVRDYLVSLGVARTRMRVVSYGEERPEDPGHSEASWTKNRRAEFLAE